MNKWLGLFLSLVLVTVWLFLQSPFASFKPVTTKDRGKIPGIVFAQEGKGEKQEESDPHSILLLKKVQEKLDEWLKSLDDRIEREDVTRFEVRFLEILRNILEWVKEKVDAKIESYSNKDEEKKEKRGTFREIRQRFSPDRGLG